MKILLLPAITKFVIVALHTINADTEEGAGDAGGEFDFIRAFFGLNGNGDKIGPGL